MTEDMIPVHPQDRMNFKCGIENTCFNDCCRNLNQALTPYDVLRLKRNLGISSQVFLKTYTARHFGPESGLPVVEFKPNPATGNACPFVTPDGCSVYTDRPASCRMYPLARAIARSRQTGEITEYFARIEEPHCRGFDRQTGQTVKEWLSGQDVDRHNRENDRLLELISLKNQILPGKLEGGQSDQFYMALYDLDEFRCQIVEKKILAEFNLPGEVLNKLQTDDEALLNFGIGWVKYMLFGIPMTFGDQADAD